MTDFTVSDQTGKTAIVTGANIGLGFETAKALASAGAHVVMACRNVVKANDAKSNILQAVSNASLEVRQLDVSDLDSVRQFAAGINTDFKAIDLLINNAGVMACPQQKSAQGFELQLATNHLGHFALTGLLLEKLEAAPAARVVALASVAHLGGRFNWQDLNNGKGYKSFPVYCQSKLANLVFAIEMDRRLKAANSSVTATAAHPGMSDTNLAYAGPAATQNIIGKGVVKVVGSFLNTAEQGAQPTLMAATADFVVGGDYFGPQGFREYKGKPGPAKMSRRAQNSDNGAKLWAESEKMTGIAYLS